MKRAVQFGAGNIGRGFLGQLYYESGYDTTFVDVSPVVVQAINERGRYDVQIVDDRPSAISVTGIKALLAGDIAGIAQALAEADIAGTSVGVSHLADLAPALAAGIALRLATVDPQPLDVILCENMLDASEFIRAKVATLLDPALLEAFNTKIGFVEASIGRMVPVMSEEQRLLDPLLVCVEAYSDLPVDAEGFRGPIPSIKNLQPKENFGAYVERKLFVHNAGHASAAYLGYLRHHDYVWQAMQDKFIRPIVDGAMAESCLGLHKKHDVPLHELQEHAEDLKRRFQNRALGDQVKRVAADPLRKLGPQDRLIGALKMCESQEIVAEHLASATAAALLYDDPDDLGATHVHAMWREVGPEGVLEQLCGLPRGSNLAKLILKQATKMSVLRLWT
jgi:mannitol-1-phosphate 5-dehydrogenase